MKIALRVDRDLIARLDAALEKLAGPYSPPSRNSALQVAIQEHVEKLEKANGGK